MATKPNWSAILKRHRAGQIARTDAPTEITRMRVGRKTGPERTIPPRQDMLDSQGQKISLPQVSILKEKQ